MSAGFHHDETTQTPAERPRRAAEALIAACYDDMRRVARRIIARDAMRLVLQPTDLVNEAALRLIQSSPGAISDQGHMLALAARTMRRILIDEARRNAAAKRRPPLLTQWIEGPSQRLVDLEDLDRALAALDAYSTEHARVVELRFGLGLTVEETSRTIGVPERTVKRRWQAARAWLLDYLSPGLGSASA